MGFVSDWSHKRALRRRLRQIAGGVWRCSFDAALIPSVSAEIGLPEIELRRLVRALDTLPGTSAFAGLLVPVIKKQVGPEKKIREVKGPGMTFSSASEQRHYQEKMELLSLVLDLPVAREHPGLAKFMMLHLAQSALGRDRLSVEVIRRAIATASQLRPESPSQAAARLQSSPQSRATPDTVAGLVRNITSLMHRLTAESGLPKLKVASGPGQEMGDERVIAEEVAVAEMEFLSALKIRDVGLLLDTLYGNPKLQTFLQNKLRVIETLSHPAQHDVAGPGRQDMMVVVRNLEQMVRAIQAESRLDLNQVRGVLNSAARFAAVPFRELLWLLANQGSARSSAPGRPLPPDADIVWTELAQLALMVRMVNDDASYEPSFLASAVSHMRHLIHELAQQFFYKPNLAVEEPSHSPEEEDNSAFQRLETTQSETRDLLLAIASLLQRMDAKQHAKQAVQIVTDLLTSPVRLTWPDCLRLANGRAECLHYWPAGENPGQWDLAIVPPVAPQDKLQVLFAPADQLLSTEMGRSFESQDLPAKVEILWGLVQYGNDYHFDGLTIGPSEVARHLAEREKELWQEVVEPITARKQAMTKVSIESRSRHAAAE